jgi:hypothetical protein
VCDQETPVGEAVKLLMSSRRSNVSRYAVIGTPTGTPTVTGVMLRGWVPHGSTIAPRTSNER